MTDTKPIDGATGRATVEVDAHGAAVIEKAREAHRVADAHDRDLAPGTSGPAVVEAFNQMLEDAAQDPCMPVRNLGGHLVACNYGDWPTFEKCKCMEGLAGIPQQATAVVVGPMPIRDVIAMTINISDDHAHDMAAGIKVAEAKRQQVKLVSAALGIEDASQQVSCVDIAEARAKLRYLEADAMLHWRVESMRVQAAAEAALAGAAAREANPLIILDTDNPQHIEDEDH